jgi:hypothetical protein
MVSTFLNVLHTHQTFLNIAVAEVRHFHVSINSKKQIPRWFQRTEYLGSKLMTTTHVRFWRDGETLAWLSTHATLASKIKLN